MPAVSNTTPECRQTHTLVELSVATECHPRLVSPVHPVNVVAFHCLDVIHGHMAGKRHLFHRTTVKAQHLANCELLTREICPDFIQLTGDNIKILDVKHHIKST